MIVVGGWPGRNVVGLNGAFGVRPAAFSTGGGNPNPLANDVDAGDSTTEFVLAVTGLPASGVVTLDDYGGFSHAGAADGTYTTSATLYTWAQGGPITQHAATESIVTTFGSSAPFALSLAGLASTLAIGAPTFTFSSPVNFAVSLAGLASTAAIGAPTVTRIADFSVSIGGLASTMALGSPAFDFSAPATFSVSLSGLASGLRIGAPTATFEWDGSMLIVEDGTGLPDAESYARVAEADAYHAARGGVAWAALNVTDKEIKLRLATDYMRQRFGGRWKGYRLTEVQALDWPRYGVVADRVALASDSVPIQVRRACCELALKAVTQALTVDEAAQVKSKQVGPISVSYADGARQNMRFAAVENMLSQLLSSGSGIKLVRA